MHEIKCAFDKSVREMSNIQQQNAISNSTSPAAKAGWCSNATTKPRKLDQLSNEAWPTSTDADLNRIWLNVSHAISTRYNAATCHDETGLQVLIEVFIREQFSQANKRLIQQAVGMLE